MKSWKSSAVRWILALVILITLLVGSISLTQTLMKARAASSPITWQVQVGAETSDRAYEAMGFFPSNIWINVGDTIVWTSKSADFHTVTFLQPGQTRPPYNPLDSTQVDREGSTHYDGVSYYNSATLVDTTEGNDILPPGTISYTSYQLTFDTPGDFTYICLLHSMMQGTVHVRPAGTAYPYTQRQYNEQILVQAGAALLDAYKLGKQANTKFNSLNVADGVGDNQASVMRFFPQNIQIHVNDTVTFTNHEAMGDHTVTFGESSSPDYLPYGDPTAFDGASPLNSGPLAPGQSYQVKFVKAGTYAFRCDFHDYMGMVATITVS